MNIRVLTGQDLFDDAEVGAAPRKTKAAQRRLFISDFRDLKPGDYVVHIDHGIGLFNGLKTIGIAAGTKEFVLLSYQDDAKLYVPVEDLEQVSVSEIIKGEISIVVGPFRIFRLRRTAG